MSDEMRLPAYGGGALADVMASIGTRVDLPGCRQTGLGLPESDRWVLLLVDGLGWDLLERSADIAPFLASKLESARRITAGVPSTTVTSLTSLGTGLTPGMHGIAGYTMRDPHADRIFSPLVWDTSTSPEDFQPMTTIFERARAEGVSVTTVLPSRFQNSGLTRAALRGGRFEPIEDELDDEARLAKTVAAAASGVKSLVYVYERRLDHAGHSHGTSSQHWRTQLARIDSFAQDLRARLPEDTTVVITGDHGMVDVTPHHRIVIEDEPDLGAEVDLIGGEARLRQLYTSTAGSVAHRWADRLGAQAWVRTRDEAIAEGWLGKVAPRVAGRFGDVLIAMKSDWAILTHQVPGEFSLVGMHGSLTPAEMDIPLILA